MAAERADDRRTEPAFPRKRRFWQCDKFLQKVWAIWSARRGLIDLRPSALVR
jgi:hypothetical protein